MKSLAHREPIIIWSADDYRALEVVLRERAGLIFSPLRRATVETAAHRVMRRVGIKVPAMFVALVKEDGAVFDDLMAEVTIGETYFFRESAQFDLLRKSIVPAFRARHPAERAFRVWSAGCSTGEEAYSIAITLREIGMPGYVVGTDISRTRLAAARRGQFRKWSFRGVPDPVIERHFTKVGETFVLGPDIIRTVEFRYLNLAADAFPAMSSGVWGMDLILCRNVLIYFDKVTIVRVAKALLATLADDGWLVLGASDPPLGEIVRCEVMQTRNGVAYRQYRSSGARPIHAPVPAPLPPEPIIVSSPLEIDDPPEVSLPVAAKVDVPLLREIEPGAAGESAVMDAYRDRNYDKVVAIMAQRILDGNATEADLVTHVRALANLGHLEAAGQACMAALDQHRQNAQLHYMHSVLMAESGLFAESARAAKRALYLDRSMVVAHLALGTTLARWGTDVAGARRSFATAERLLSAMRPDQLVPDSDGEPAGRLLEMTRAQCRLLPRAGISAVRELAGGTAA
jgi:chemotaxis protein methyltransferase CheR